MKLIKFQMVLQMICIKGLSSVFFAYKFTYFGQAWIVLDHKVTEAHGEPDVDEDRWQVND